MAVLGLAQQLLEPEFFTLAAVVQVVQGGKHLQEYPDLVVLAVAMVAEHGMVVLKSHTLDFLLLQTQVLGVAVAVLVMQAPLLQEPLAVMADRASLLFATPKSMPPQL
jgi:hypothetical protein